MALYQSGPKRDRDRGQKFPLLIKRYILSFMMISWDRKQVAGDKKF
jgi:hypothetical protein